MLTVWWLDSAVEDVVLESEGGSWTSDGPSWAAAPGPRLTAPLRHHAEFSKTALRQPRPLFNIHNKCCIHHAARKEHMRRSLLEQD